MRRRVGGQRPAVLVRQRRAQYRVRGREVLRAHHAFYLGVTAWLATVAVLAASR